MASSLDLNYPGLMSRAEKVTAIERLSAVSLVRVLPERARRAVLDRTRVRSFRRGDVVSQEGAISSRLVVVLDGFLKLSVSRLDGSSRVASVVGEGAVPCWSDVLAGTPQRVSMVGLQNGVLAELPIAPIRYGVSSHADFAFLYANEVARWAASLQEQIVMTRAASVPERLAGLLSYLLEHCGDVSTGLIQAHLSRQELAEAAGTTAETTIRVLGKWEKAGHIGKLPSGGLRILNVDWLHEVADGID